MSMFRRPTDDSSDSDSSSDGPEETDGNDDHSQSLSQASSEEFIGPDLTATETLSSGESISVGSEHDAGTVQNAEHHRNMMLASLLEEFYRTRAVELFNASNPSGGYHRQSPEIQPFVQTLFAQASQDLASAGILPAHVSGSGLENARKQYLVGFDNLGLQNLKDSELLPEAIRRRISQDNGDMAVVKAASQGRPNQPSLLEASTHELALLPKARSLIPHPGNDLQLSSTSQPRSHYLSSFHETRMLGKGGFGRVYQTYNIFDQCEYAVKKIPLSPKLSQRYHDYGHGELRHILREVQALAQLDHCNVVRYHATWIEEPRTAAVGELVRPVPTRLAPNQKLLDNKPAFKSQSEREQVESAQHDASDGADGILFADSHAGNGATAEIEWSHQSNGLRLDESSALGSDIFTDGISRRPSQGLIIDDPHCYVLHVQMSMYPMTLTQYLQTGSSAAKQKNLISASRRHCFHVIPSLRILLGILSGLQYVHAKGLIHRDIKPSNIFLSFHEDMLHDKDPEGFLNVGSCRSCPNAKPYFVNPRIGDFGLVADLAMSDTLLHGSPSSSSGKIVGTQFYQPPVGHKDKKEKATTIVDEKVDVFALGVILMELICPCGTSMERLDMLKGLQEGYVRDSVLCPEETSLCEGGDGLVRALIMGMTQADHHQRLSCSQVKDLVCDLLAKFEHPLPP